MVNYTIFTFRPLIKYAGPILVFYTELFPSCARGTGRLGEGEVGLSFLSVQLIDLGFLALEPQCLRVERNMHNVSVEK